MAILGNKYSIAVGRTKVDDRPAVAVAKVADMTAEGLCVVDFAGPATITVEQALDALEAVRAYIVANGFVQHA
jgi:hypothetical protein